MAATPSITSPKVVPAQLSFLAIYNPGFGQTDETASGQIFYYFSREDLVKQRQGDARRSQGKGASKSGSSDHGQNARLRQVGLARGMVEFAK